MPPSDRRPPPLPKRSPPSRPSGRQSTRRLAAARAVSSSSDRELWVLVGVLVGVLVLVSIWALLRQADRTLSEIEQEDPRSRAPVVVAEPRADDSIPIPTAVPPIEAVSAPMNILLLGVDSRTAENGGVRSDTLILVHLDPQERWASMLSIPRDSVVNVPNLGWAKINAAYSYGFNNADAIYGPGTEPDAGGGALAAQAVEQFLGVRVDYIAQVDFEGFEQLVDAIGGVIIDVEKPLLDSEFPTDEGYGVERVYIPAGLQVLNGRDALVYARSRHSSSDFDRSRRQQHLLRALQNQVRSRGLLENAALLPQWADVLAQNVRTTLPVRDLGVLNGLATFAASLDSERIVQVSINPDDVGIDSVDGSDIYWNQADVQVLVARWQRGPSGAQLATEDARIQVLNGAAVDGVAGQVTTYLSSQGFALTEAATAPQVYAHSLIIDYSGRPETLQRLTRTLGIEPRYVQTVPGPDAPASLSGADIVVVIGQDYKNEWLQQ